MVVSPVIAKLPSVTGKETFHVERLTSRLLAMHQWFYPCLLLIVCVVVDVYTASPSKNSTDDPENVRET